MATDDAGPTRREQPEATRRESDGVAATRRESAAAPAGGDTGYVRVNVPPEIRDRYAVVRELPSGGEADVLLVQRLADPPEAPPVVLKIYRRDIEPDAAALERIRGLSAAHVVRVFDAGSSVAGLWEEQEYIAGGSLAELLQREGPRLTAERLGEVIAELADALEAVHPTLHRDIKPGNVLVRSSEPLDLVLGDFGLARTAESSSILSTRAGSLAYQSPEALEGVASTARDWWAVGMMVAEAAMGRHPYYDREWLPERELRIALTTRPVPLDDVGDPRIELLCRGLLVRDPRERWGLAEVRAWQRGETPRVADEPARRPDGRVPPFVFQGQRCASPQELAPAFAQHWAAALQLISGAASEAPDYVRLVTWLREHRHEPALRVLEAGARDRSVARRLFRLQRVLAAELPPTFRGHVVDHEGVVALARAAADGDEEAGSVVYDLQKLGILGELGREEAHAEFATVDERWRAEIALLERLRGELGEIGKPLGDERVERTAHARILEALLDGAALQELVERVDAARREPAIVENERLRNLFDKVTNVG